MTQHEWCVKLRSLIAAAAVIACIWPAFAQPNGLPAKVAAKLVDGSVLDRLWADPTAHMPVIVEFAVPAADPRGLSGSQSQAAVSETAVIHATQNAILKAALGSDALASPAATGLDIKRMDFSPMFAMTVSATQLASLAADPRVIRIHEDRLSEPAPNPESGKQPRKDVDLVAKTDLSEPLLDESVPLIGMPAAYAAGATGAGWAIALLDTGVFGSHEFLVNKVVSAACYSTNGGNATSRCPNGAVSSTDINSAPDCVAADNGVCGLGSTVSGIAAGFNTNRQAGEPANGVARAGSLIAINVYSKLSQGPNCSLAPCLRSFTSDQILGLERVYSLRATFRIAAVLIDVVDDRTTGTACDSDPRKAVIDRLRAAGIATVIGTGLSDVDNNQIGKPACISSAIAVTMSTKQDQLVAYDTAWSPLVDLVAPGYSIAVPEASRLRTSDYSYYAGGLMAAGHVAGAFAAIKTVRPEATVNEIEAALKSTGLPITYMNITKPRIRVDRALGAVPISSSIFAAVTPVARATFVNGTVTAYATILNAGSTTATNCSPSMPAGYPVVFGFSARNVTTGNPENPNVPVNIAPGNTGRGFVISFKPTSQMSSNIPLVFDCTNTAPATSFPGLNTFLLTATSAAPADLLSIAVTATQDGIMNVPLGSTGFAALAAQNIGAAANLQARLDVNPIGTTGRSLAGSFSICQTNPNTGQCITGQAQVLNFSAPANQIVTFTAFVNSNGQAIPFDPANKRLFVHFFQGANPVGSASVAVRTTASPSPAVALAN